LDLTEFLKMLHVIFAVIWVGGGFASQMYALRARAADDPARMAQFGQDTEWIGTRIFTPASLLVLALGITMVVREPAYAFGDTWILIGLGGILFSALVGSLFLGPESGRLAKVITEKGPSDPEVNQRIARLTLVSRIELGILLLVVADMVVKPGFP
jgi:uncharacterized membrane protein